MDREFLLCCNQSVVKLGVLPAGTLQICVCVCISLSLSLSLSPSPSLFSFSSFFLLSLSLSLALSLPLSMSLYLSLFIFSLADILAILACAERRYLHLVANNRMPRVLTLC